MFLTRQPGKALDIALRGASAEPATDSADMALHHPHLRLSMDSFSVGLSFLEHHHIPENFLISTRDVNVI